MRQRMRADHQGQTAQPLAAGAGTAAGDLHWCAPGAPCTHDTRAAQALALLGRLAAAAIVLVSLALPAGAQDRATAIAPPVFSVQVEVREGRVAIVTDSERIDWRDERTRKVFEDCGLGDDALRSELGAYLRAQFAARPRALEELLDTRTHPARLRELALLAARDPATERLWHGTMPWRDAALLTGQWSQARRSEGATLVSHDLALASVFSALHENNRALAEGPLLPIVDDSDPTRMRQGLMDFALAPPLRDIKLRTTANVAQWQRLRGALAEQALQDQRCRLWFRPRIADALQDMLEVRGMATSTLLSAKDLKDSRALGTASTAAQEHANIRISRPHWGDTQAIAPGQAQGLGGRILLEPDPLIAAVYLRGPMASVQRALYLLLPSDDAARVRQDPHRYLCAAEAVWLPQEPRPPAVQLPLDDAMPGIQGSTLAITGRYITRGVLAERAQRLAAIGYSARLAMFHERLAPDAAALKARGESPLQHLALLIVEPASAADADADAASAASPADLPVCATPRDTPKARPECPPGETGEHCAARTQALETEPADPRAAPATPRQQRARQPPRNHLELGAEWRAGRPLRWGGEYRRDGLTPGDQIVVGLGQQRQASGNLSYSSDFVGFDALGRRLQVTARVFSEFTPERAIDASLPDERQQGAALRGVLDLWRDRAGSFGQAEFGVARSRAQLTSAGLDIDTPTTTLVDASFAFARSDEGTPASLHTEAQLGLARGRFDGAGFGKLSAEASAQGLMGRLDRWRVRAQWARLSGNAPRTEYLAFGGPDSVRGYREEQASGRRAWVVQGEYWRPLPWLPADDGLARLLRRSVALAFFADVGALAASPTGFAGTKSAVGLGLRWRYGSLLTLRLDVARPVGSVAPGDHGTRLQFGVSTLRTL